MILLSLKRLSGARVFLNGCRTRRDRGVGGALSGARVFLNGCRTH